MSFLFNYFSQDGGRVQPVGSYRHPFLQNGGAKCSLCGSEGTNKSTCPLNPSATKPNPTKHSKAVAQQQTKQSKAVAQQQTKQSKQTKTTKKGKQITKKIAPSNPTMLAQLPLPVLENMIENNLITPVDLAYLKKVNKELRDYLESTGNVGTFTKQTIKKAYCQPIQEGIDALNGLSLTIGGELNMDDIAYWDEEKEDMVPATKEILDQPFSLCPEIIVNMPASTWKEFENVEEQFVFPRIVKAGDGQVVRVRDILKEWIANNKRINKLEEQTKEEAEKRGEKFWGLFGDHIYFEGIDHIKDNIYTMENYGS